MVSRTLDKKQSAEKWSFGFSVAACLWLALPFLVLPLSSFAILICFLLFLFCYGVALILYLNKPLTDSRLEMLTAVLLILETLPILFAVSLGLLSTLDSGPGFRLD